MTLSKLRLLVAFPRPQENPIEQIWSVSPSKWVPFNKHRYGNDGFSKGLFPFLAWKHDQS